eukprot:TRINITY_DN74519_c0_g1_i1.p1 TRINITY_DN74519_c0_g1~~TRINITY_DN74519_c0_g1_i1.p1  ORF type:complete len:242 (+),score=25.78 TRINITY_DN74519_c0_g1_i1:23-748(+)
MITILISRANGDVSELSVDPQGSIQTLRSDVRSLLETYLGVILVREDGFAIDASIRDCEKTTVEQYGLHDGDILTAIVGDLPSNQTYSTGQNLVPAARIDDVSAVKQIMARGCDINLVCNLETIPLHVAVESGSIGVTRCLLEHQANVNTVNKWGYTALATAQRLRRDHTKPLLLRERLESVIEILQSFGAAETILKMTRCLGCDAILPRARFREHCRTARESHDESFTFECEDFEVPGSP